MENTNIDPAQNPSTAPKVKWGIKVRCEPEAGLYEVKVTLPIGEEDNLPNLLEPGVIQAFPEIMRALASGRLPGNEIDLANRAKA